MKEIQISIQEAYIGNDSLYRAFYRCPDCGCDSILIDFEFCPKCGGKLIWKITWKT